MTVDPKKFAAVEKSVAELQTKVASLEKDLEAAQKLNEELEAKITDLTAKLEASQAEIAAKAERTRRAPARSGGRTRGSRVRRKRARRAIRQGFRRAKARLRNRDWPACRIRIHRPGLGAGDTSGDGVITTGQAKTILDQFKSLEGHERQAFWRDNKSAILAERAKIDQAERSQLHSRTRR